MTSENLGQERSLFDVRITTRIIRAATNSDVIWPYVKPWNHTAAARGNPSSNLSNSIQPNITGLGVYLLVWSGYFVPVN